MAVNNTSPVTFSAEGGTTYRIAVDGVKGASGEFTLTIRNVPPGDEFAQATKLAGPLPIKVLGSNDGFSVEKGEPELVNEDPEKGGWLFRVQLSDAGELSSLMDKAAYDAFVAGL